jgi:hypothetical protein
VASARPPLLGTAPCPHVRRKHTHTHTHTSLLAPTASYRCVAAFSRRVVCLVTAYILTDSVGGREEGWKGAYMTWLRAAAKRYRYLNTPSACSFEFQAFLALDLAHRGRPLLFARRRNKNASRFVHAPVVQAGQPAPAYSCLVKILLAGDQYVSSCVVRVVRVVRVVCVVCVVCVGCVGCVCAVC